MLLLSQQNIFERNHTKICSPTLTLVPFVSKLVNYLLSCQSLKTYKKSAIKVDGTKVELS